MANTYTQIHIQVIFCVKFRNAMIGRSWKEDLYKYISGIIKQQGHKLIIINGMEDHVHILIGLRPNQSLSDLVKKVKESSSRWINERSLTGSKFSWQSGFGAFSYSQSHLARVIKYIRNQEVHHRSKTFFEEYREFLEAFDVDFNEDFIFKKQA